MSEVNDEIVKVTIGSAYSSSDDVHSHRTPYAGHELILHTKKGKKYKLLVKLSQIQECALSECTLIGGEE